jgi:hypothetical protein
MRTVTVLIATLTATLWVQEICNAQPLDDWPHKDRYGPPAVIYPLRATCGDLLRAKTGSVDYEYLKIWVMGFVSGQNSMLPMGGNVLGSLNSKIEDFMFTVKRTCEQDPAQDFLLAIYSSLGKVKPVNWKGKPKLTK